MNGRDDPREGERSKLLASILGEQNFQTFMQNKRLQWQQFSEAVTDFKIKTYLPIL